MVVRFQLLAVVALLALSCLIAQANEDTRGGLATALRQHYKLATSKLGADGRLTFEPGTRLTVKKEGIMSYETADTAVATLCPSMVKGGTVKSSADLACTKLAPVNRRAFRVSETVCVTAMDVNPAADELSMVLVTCDPYNPVPKNKTNRAVVLFVFPKGTLGKTTSAKIEEVIGQTLSEGRNETATKPGASAAASAEKENTVQGDTGPENDSKQQDPPKPAGSEGNGAGAGDTGDGPDQPGSAGQPGSQAEAGEPAQPAQPATADVAEKAKQVTKGQTMEQVTAILGQPSSIADLHTKIVYFYPNLRVFFVDGKVSEVHRIGS
jgi:hypothetical protein